MEKLVNDEATAIDKLLTKMGEETLIKLLWMGIQVTLV